MKRLEKFAISKRPYAVDLASLRVVESDLPHGRRYYQATVRSAWFRRRSGVTVACLGTLWDGQTVEPTDAYAFLAAHEDGRYGGNCHARWDGVNLWAPQMPFEKAESALAVLRPMLDAYPDVPDGFDGWWAF